MPRIFSKDVDRDELLYLREHEHLSNAEIAQRYGVSQSTIYNLIGKAPKDCRRKPVRQPTIVTPLPAIAAPDELDEPYEACLMVKQPTLVLESISQAGGRLYRLDTDTLLIEEDSNDLIIPLDELPDLIRELTAIQRKSAALTAPRHELI